MGSAAAHRQEFGGLFGGKIEGDHETQADGDGGRGAIGGPSLAGARVAAEEAGRADLGQADALDGGAVLVGVMSGPLRQSAIRQHAVEPRRRAVCFTRFVSR
jgi:hypothetical protein